MPKPKPSCSERIGRCVQNCLRRPEPCPCMEKCFNMDCKDKGTGPVSIAARWLRGTFADADHPTRLLYGEIIHQTQALLAADRIRTESHWLESRSSPYHQKVTRTGKRKSGSARRPSR